MKYFEKIILAGFVVCTFAACDKDPEQTGCTDQFAVNYDPGALKDDGSCVFNQDEQLIWSNGMRGGWNGDLQEGAFRLELCTGDMSESIQKIDSTSTISNLYLGTGGGTELRAFFSLINERNASDFAEGSLRMGIRLPDSLEGSPDYIRLYIGGKILESAECSPHRRSEFVEISTHSFNDSTFTEVNIPIRHFAQIRMAHVNVVCGFQFDGDRSTGIIIDKIRWVANKEKE